jgi:hypothetical protein
MLVLNLLGEKRCCCIMVNPETLTLQNGFLSCKLFFPRKNRYCSVHDKKHSILLYTFIFFILGAVLKQYSIIV